jgi:hypothetical protein
MAYVAVSNSPIRVRQTGPVDPGFGQGDPGRPDNSLPGGGYPSHGLPPGGQIDNSLPEPPPGIWPPASPGHPWLPIPPDASTKPPPGTVWPPLGEELPDGEFWVVVGIPGVGWRYVCVDLNLRPDNSLPGSGARPDNSLPGQPGHPANRPPGQGAPPRPDNTLPPTAEPKR